jgi:hypothetical protein
MHTYAQAQKKKPSAKTTTSSAKKDTTVVRIDSAVKKAVLQTPIRKIDTVIIIDPKTGKPVAAKDQPEVAKVPPAKKADTIIFVDNKPAKPTVSVPTSTPRRIDTVIILSKGKQTTALLKDMPKTDIVKVVKVNEVCNCVSMNVTSQDTLHYEDYINYSFAFKNNCKERVYINSSCFGFLVFNPNGVPVRTLRKVDFAKQYRYPEYVELRPGEEYMFQFGEDPFFRYDMHQGWQYKFTFTYVNTKFRYRNSPDNTYSCSQFRDKMVMVK